MLSYAGSPDYSGKSSCVLPRSFMELLGTTSPPELGVGVREVIAGACQNLALRGNKVSL